MHSIISWVTSDRIAVFISIGAFAVALRGLKWQRRAALAAIRSANAAEEANANRQLTEATVGGTPAPLPTSRNVQWKIERPQKTRFVLRNLGTDVATGVTVDASRIEAVARELPQDMSIRPGASASFMLIGSWGTSMPHEIWVSWDGHEEAVAVPVPER